MKGFKASFLPFIPPFFFISVCSNLPFSFSFSLLQSKRGGSELWKGGSVCNGSTRINLLAPNPLSTEGFFLPPLSPSLLKSFGVERSPPAFVILVKHLKCTVGVHEDHLVKSKTSCWFCLWIEWSKCELVSSISTITTCQVHIVKQDYYSIGHQCNYLLSAFSCI